MNFAALLQAYSMIKALFPVISAVAQTVDAAMPDSPGKAKAEAAFSMLGHVASEFKAVTPELQVAFNGAISLYQTLHGVKTAP